MMSKERLDLQLPLRPSDVPIFGELTQAYALLNRGLFLDALPACAITANRRLRTFGYFKAASFARGISRVDEISMNAAYMCLRTMRSTLATMASLACQFKVYNESGGYRRYYKGKLWSNAMEDIGLIPSVTGHPGGKKTGETVSCYIEEGGRFDVLMDALNGSRFAFEWTDRFPLRPPKKYQDLEIYKYRGAEMVDRILGKACDLAEQLSLPPKLLFDPSMSRLESECLSLPSIHPRAKVAYLCVCCGTKLWGRPNLQITCTACQCAFEPVGLIHSDVSIDDAAIS